MSVVEENRSLLVGDYEWIGQLMCLAHHEFTSDWLLFQHRADGKTFCISLGVDTKK